MTAIIRIDKCKGEIIVGIDENKVKNVKSENKIENKNKNNIKKSYSYKNKIIIKDDKKKCKSRIASTKSCNKVGDRNRNYINIELSKNNIYNQILSKNGASNRNIRFWNWKIEKCNKNSKNKDKDGRTYKNKLTQIIMKK